MVTLHLSDPGMKPKSVEFESTEDALESLARGDCPQYTSAIVEVDGKTTHFSNRDVGESNWVTRRKI